MPREKVILSACLLGQNCRYDGKTKKVDKLLEAFKDYEIIPFCPEAPLFGTPRQRINVVSINDENRIITDETNKDVTQILVNEIQNFIKKYPHAKNIVLKSKSPSCGLATTPILDQNRDILAKGNGIAAQMFLNHYKNSKIKDENFYL